MSSREFSEWIAFLSVEPLGDDRGDIQAAMIAATIANANRDPEKRSNPFEATDFLLDYWTAKTGQHAGKSPEDMLNLVRLWMPPQGPKNGNHSDAGSSPDTRS
jgi:hypothetical protein